MINSHRGGGNPLVSGLSYPGLRRYFLLTLFAPRVRYILFATIAAGVSPTTKLAAWHLHEPSAASTGSTICIHSCWSITKRKPAMTWRSSPTATAVNWRMPVNLAHSVLRKFQSSNCRRVRLRFF